MAIFDFGGLSAELQAKTDAELAAILPTLTTGPIKIDAAQEWLREQLLAVPDPFDGFVGPIADAAKDDTKPEALRAGLRKFLGYLLVSKDTQIHTNLPAVGVETATVMSLLKAASIVTDAQIAAFYALDGGLAYPGVTQAEITTSRANYAVQVAAEEAKAAFEALSAHAINEYILTATNKAELITALTDAKTYVEVQ